MAFLHNDVYDNGLSVLSDDVDELHICSQLPSTYAAAVGDDSLGDYDAVSVGAPGAGSPDGRQVTIAAITTGATATDTGNATHWALVDTQTSRLLAAGTLSGGGQSVTEDNPFTLASFTIRISAPA